MKKSGMLEEMARRGALDPAAAADQMELALVTILNALRSGHSARLPGLGTIIPGEPWTFEPETHES
ncbi:MAG: HU family DNA-binding protein [Acidobacteriota bacterium]|nr:HU family DNA-binding protein [Acidobacteriota bacterium]